MLMPVYALCEFRGEFMPWQAADLMQFVTDRSASTAFSGRFTANAGSCCKPFATGTHAASETAALTAMAMKTVLKKKAATPWASTALRIAVVFTWTSETWQVKPTTKEK